MEIDFTTVRRIAVVGCGGSGKSTLAQGLGQRLDLPIHYLDRLFWKPGWVQRSLEEFAQLHDRLLDEPRWVLDGNYSRTLSQRAEAADLLIFLDLPTRVCLWSVLRRRFHGDTHRIGQIEGCPEKVDLIFLHWIARYRYTHRPRVLQILEGYKDSKQILILPSRRAVNGLLKSLHNSAPTPSRPLPGA